jgi:hypothetical protein
MKYLRVKKWDEHQHYTDRDPPWIKVYNRLLDDYDFLSLAESAQSHLVKLWLLASRTDNKIPYDLAFITTKIGAKSVVNIDDLIVAGWLELADVSAIPARPAKERKVNARKKKDRERKKDTGREQSASHSASVPRLEERRGETEESREEKKPKYPYFTRDACDRLYAAWGALGKPPYSAFRKAFGPLFPEKPPFTVSQVEAAIAACIQEAKAEGETRYTSPQSFVARVQHWVELTTPIAQRDPARAYALGVVA